MARPTIKIRGKAKIKPRHHKEELVEPPPPRPKEMKEHVEEKVREKAKPSIKPKEARALKSGKITRVFTGIDGLDGLIEGGFPEKSMILLTGSCGTGKTIFGMKFLVEGALRGEPGVYISLEESIEDNMKQMRFFGWPVDRLVKEKKLLIVQPEMYRFDALMTTIEDSIDKIKAKRIVLDSASVIGMYFHDVYKVRRSLLDLSRLLKKSGCTSIAISETKEGQVGLSSYGVEEFVADGVIVLYYVKKENRFLRALTIRKMRSTNHSLHICPIEIKRPGGIVVYPSEEVFTEVR